jgi:hypothetical protein
LGSVENVVNPSRPSADTHTLARYGTPADHEGARPSLPIPSPRSFRVIRPTTRPEPLDGWGGRRHDVGRGLVTSFAEAIARFPHLVGAEPTSGRRRR